jgi:hypothetical protein
MARRAWLGDAGYRGVEKRQKGHGSAVRWLAMRASKRPSQPNTPIDRLQERLEQAKASLRARVELSYHIIKNRLGLKRTLPRFAAAGSGCVKRKSAGIDLERLARSGQGRNLKPG